jgi:hypothetical protein
MKRGSTIFLKIAVFLIGIIGVAFCIFWLPSLASRTAEREIEFAYLQYPVLIGIYVTAIPFFFALYQALKLLSYIDKNKAFSQISVNALKYIKYCAFTISIWYAVGIPSLFLIMQQIQPPMVTMGFLIVFTSAVIAVFAAVLQKLLKEAIDIKSENDLTV